MLFVFHIDFAAMVENFVTTTSWIGLIWQIWNWVVCSRDKRRDGSKMSENGIHILESPKGTNKVPQYYLSELFFTIFHFLNWDGIPQIFCSDFVPSWNLWFNNKFPVLLTSSILWGECVFEWYLISISKCQLGLIFAVTVKFQGFADIADRHCSNSLLNPVLRSIFSFTNGIILIIR